MITSVSADLNILGNPQIFKDLNSSNITIAKKATNVVITITPIAGYNAANTATTNAGVIPNINSRGFNIAFNASTIVLTNNVSPITPSVLLGYALVIKNGANATIDIEFPTIEVLNPTFTDLQTRCKYCSTLTPTLVDTTSQNLPIANRGKIEYIFIDALGTEQSLATADYNTAVSYCWCGAGTNLDIRSVLTIRQIPNCGGTSPIVFQAIDTSQIDILEIEPTIQFEADFDCCIADDNAVEVSPVSLTLNISDTGINDGCTTGQLSLKYDLFNPANEEVVITELKTGTISTSTASKTVIGTGSSFTTQFVKGSKLYKDNNEIDYIGIVDTITNDTALTLLENSLYTLTNVDYRSNKYYYATVNTNSVFDYTPTEKGTFVLKATLENCCTIVKKEWSINICNSWVLITGTCNNPVVKNISAINFLRFTLKTYNGVNLVDNVTNFTLFEDELVSPLSEIELGTLQDGFYIITIDYLDSNGIVQTTTEQVLFYDCYIKTCEFELDVELFSVCNNCDSQIENDKLFYERSRFEILKNSIYSYWNKIKKEQSIPSSWDIENHLAELATYSGLVNQLKALCGKCENNNTYNSSIVYSKSDPCGCNK